MWAGGAKELVAQAEPQLDGLSAQAALGFLYFFFFLVLLRTKLLAGRA